MATDIDKWLRDLGYEAKYLPDIARPRWQVRPSTSTSFNVVTCTLPCLLDDDFGPDDPSPLQIEIAKLAAKFESIRFPLVVVVSAENITDRCVDDVSEIFKAFPNLSAVSLAIQDSHNVFRNRFAKDFVDLGHVEERLTVTATSL